MVYTDQPVRVLTESMDIVYVDEQRMPRSDCMDVHAHLDLSVYIWHKDLFWCCVSFDTEYHIGMLH